MGASGNVGLMLLFTAIAALGQGPWQGDMNAVIAACSEYTWLTKHKRVDGTMYSCTSLGVKLGGGIGTAPMFQLTRELAAAGVKPDVFFGFRDTPYCMEEYREIANLVKVSTDTGAVGFHGFVTQLYDPADYDVVLVCGPTVMMRNAARLCAEKGTPCFVSMEKKMACGIGACLGCTCETRSGEGKSVCKNGPVFDATEVFF